MERFKYSVFVICPGDVIMAKKKAKKAAPAKAGVNDSIKDAIRYPWTKMKRAFWFWLILIPIFGWLPLYGYMLDIFQNITGGKDKELPKFGKYWGLFVQGFYYLVFALIVGIVVQLALRIPVAGWILYVYIMMITPMLLVNYAVKRRFGAFFDIGLATKLIFGNIIQYIILVLKIIVVTLFWLVCSIPIITLVWTMPAMQFSSGFLIAQFYRKYQKH